MNISIGQISEDLLGVYPPKYEKAEIDQNVTWLLTCKNWGTIHKIATDTTELDYCCDTPNFGGINENN